MSINALSLAGWDETSTWGVDNGTFYAQLTPNGLPDDGGPQIWIAPPRFVLRDSGDLANAIAQETGAPVEDVVAAMRDFASSKEPLDPEPTG